MNTKSHSDISVIVNVFCPDDALWQTLDSVLAQTLCPLEVLVVDDGSPKAYDHFFQELRRRYQNTAVRLIRNDVNQGVAVSRNQGVALALGELICFLDQDDYWPFTKLQDQAEKLWADTNLHGVAGTQVFLQDASLTQKPSWMGQREFNQPYPGTILGALMIRKTALAQVGGFDPNLQHGTDDVDWFFRAKAMGLAIDYTPQVALYKRIHAGNTSRYARQHNAELLKVVRRHLPKP